MILKSPICIISNTTVDAKGPGLSPGEDMDVNVCLGWPHSRVALHTNKLW